MGVSHLRNRSLYRLSIHSLDSARNSRIWKNCPTIIIITILFKNFKNLNLNEFIIRGKNAWWITLSNIILIAINDFYHELVALQREIFFFNCTLFSRLFFYYLVQNSGVQSNSFVNLLILYSALHRVRIATIVIYANERSVQKSRRNY